jgi:hypothetical protein
MGRHDGDFSSASVGTSRWQGCGLSDDDERNHSMTQTNITVATASTQNTKARGTPAGRHGLGLADGVAYGDHGSIHVPHTAQWSAACAAWLRAEGFLPAGEGVRVLPGS